MCSTPNSEMGINEVSKILTYNSDVKPQRTINKKLNGPRTVINYIIFLVLVLKCETSSVNAIYPESSSSTSMLSENENASFQSFRCPDTDNREIDTRGDWHNFCEEGIIPRQETLNIHSEEFEKLGNFSVNAKNFAEHRVCVKSFQDKQVTIIRCETQDGITNESPQNSMSNPNPNVLVLRKCCRNYHRLVKVNSSQNVSAYDCIPTGISWDPALFSNVEWNFGKHVDLKDISKRVVLISGFPVCNNGEPKMMDNYEDIIFKILSTTGEVLVGLKFWFRPVWLPVHNDKQNQSYCLDELEIPLSPGEIDNRHQENYSHTINHKNQVLVYCEIERFDDYLFHRKLFGILCVSASCVILLLLIIYLSVYDRQNLAGWTQFNIFVAVFFVFGMEGGRTLVNLDGLDVKATVSCTVVAAIAQYFFFALNTCWFVMNFDLFWTFWKLESSSKGLNGKGRRISAYLAISWVLPLVLILIFFGLKHSEANSSKGNMRGIYSEAHRRCSSPAREFGFQTLGVMFLCNTIFFGVTAVLIWKHRRGITTSRRNSRTERHTWRSNAVFGRVILFAKLFMVMGVSSLTIPLDYFFGSEDPLNPFEVLFRMVHFIPVVAILFIFGFNEKNMHLIKQKYPNFGTVMGVEVFSLNRNRGTTETNPSPSGGQNSTEIK